MAAAGRAPRSAELDLGRLAQVFEQLDVSRPFVCPAVDQDTDLLGYSIFLEALKDHDDWWEYVNLLADGDAGCGAAVGSLIGLALGDAAGHPLEFIAVDQSLPDGPAGDYLNPRRPQLHPYLGQEAENIKYSNHYNRFQLLYGQWTDDTSMALCLADSLLANRAYHAGDVRVRWHMWWWHSYNNAFRMDLDRERRTSVGLGGNVSKSLDELEDLVDDGSGGDIRERVPRIYASRTNDAGNGTIMRLAPVPIAYHSSFSDAMDIAAMQSRASHPGGEAAACCCFMTYFIVQAIAAHKGGEAPGTNPRSFVDSAVREFLALDESHMKAYWSMSGCQRTESMARLAALLRCEPPSAKEVNWHWKRRELAISEAISARRRRAHGMEREEARYNGHPVIPTYFGAYCMDGLAMALWSLWHSADFSSCILNAINLLGDADTVGAIAGQMAGALYGWSDIKANEFSKMCLMNLMVWDPHCEIGLRAALLYFHGPLPQLRLEQADGHATVRVFDEPKSGAAVVGEIPSGTIVECCGTTRNFNQIRWNGIAGWVGLKNCANHHAVGARLLREEAAGIATE